MAIITVGAFNAGVANNVIPQTATLKLSVRSLARDVAEELVGADKVVRQGRALTGSEDFAFMLEEVPGCYLLIGNGNGDGSGDGHGACMVHNPGYDFNDQNVAVGSAYWSLLVERFLPAQV
jgi:hippurate hydrolase